MRRHRALVAGAVLVGIALVGATVVALAWKHRRAVESARFDALAADVERSLDACVAVITTGSQPCSVAREHLDRGTARSRELDLLATRSTLDEVRVARAHTLHDRVRALDEAVARDSRDEEALESTVTLVSRDDGTAALESKIAILARFESSPSRFAGDATAYRRWLLADLRVREAWSLARAGDTAVARALLEATLAEPWLGPDARASVQRRLDALARGEVPGRR